MDLDDLLRLREEYERSLDAAEDQRAAFYRAIRRVYMSGTPLQEIADHLGVSRQRIHQIVGAEPQRGKRRRGGLAAMMIAIMAVGLVGSLRAAALIPPLRLSFLEQGVTTLTIEGQHVMLLREGDALRGFLARVPHLNERLAWCPNERVFLSFAHGELFDRRGRYVSGPATRDLDRVDVRLRGDEIIIDPLRVIRSDGRSAGSVSGPVLAAYRYWYNGHAPFGDFCARGVQ